MKSSLDKQKSKLVVAVLVIVMVDIDTSSLQVDLWPWLVGHCVNWAYSCNGYSMMTEI